MTKENKDHLSVNSLIDFLKFQKDVALSQAAENLSSYWGLTADSPSRTPSTVQYTHGVGNLANRIAQHNHPVAILFDSQEAVDFAIELRSERKNELVSIIEDPLSIEEVSFPISPDGNGWKNVILDDILMFIGGDLQLVALLRAVYYAMADEAKLILRVPKLSKSSWNREYNSTVVTEAIEKRSLRKYERIITSHGEIELRHVEEIFDFAIGDLHESARSANFRPTRDMGLDPSVWCCYDKV